VQRVFGRWNRAIHAAGHDPRRPGERLDRHHGGLRDANGRFLSPQGESA
jgi:hypothetical protein